MCPFVSVVPCFGQRLPPPKLDLTKPDLPALASLSPTKQRSRNTTGPVSALPSSLFSLYSLALAKFAQTTRTHASPSILLNGTVSERRERETQREREGKQLEKVRTRVQSGNCSFFFFPRFPTDTIQFWDEESHAYVGHAPRVFLVPSRGSFDGLAEVHMRIQSCKWFTLKHEPNCDVLCLLECGCCCECVCLLWMSSPPLHFQLCMHMQQVNPRKVH